MAKPHKSSPDALPATAFGGAADNRAKKLPSVQSSAHVLARELEQTFGTSGTGKNKRVNNPFRMSPEEAYALAKRAGIITKSGKLSRKFR